MKDRVEHKRSRTLGFEHGRDHVDTAFQAYSDALAAPRPSFSQRMRQLVRAPVQLMIRKHIRASADRPACASNSGCTRPCRFDLGAFGTIFFSVDSDLAFILARRNVRTSEILLFDAGAVNHFGAAEH